MGFFDDVKNITGIASGLSSLLGGGNKQPKLSKGDEARQSALQAAAASSGRYSPTGPFTSQPQKQTGGGGGDWMGQLSRLLQGGNMFGGGSGSAMPADAMKASSGMPAYGMPPLTAEQLGFGAPTAAQIYGPLSAMSGAGVLSAGAPASAGAATGMGSAGMMASTSPAWLTDLLMALPFLGL